MSQAGITSLKNALPPAGPIDTLTGNTGGAVGPTAGNINVVGATGEITVAGTPGTSTLLISLAAQSGVFTVTTNDATLTPLITIPIANPEAIVLVVTLIAAPNDNSASIGGQFTTTASNNGAGAVISGTGGDYQTSFPGLTQAFFSVSGNNVVFFVSGEVATTINWKAYFNFLIL